MEPVAGSKIAACTNADCAVFDSLHPPRPGAVAVSWYGVARPLALSGSGGMINVQLGLGTAELADVPGLAAAAATCCICEFSRSVSGGLLWAFTDETHIDSTPTATATLIYSLERRMIPPLLH